VRRPPVVAAEQPRDDLPRRVGLACDGLAQRPHLVRRLTIGQAGRQ
jgi:hypothetical protein